MDKYEKLLETKLLELKQCQAEQEITSCMSCRSYLKCILREEYVSSVYSSMSKGKSGGFEF